MEFAKQSQPMFVPFQDRSVHFEPSKSEKVFKRRMVTSIVVFLVSVTIVSFVTNKYEERLREAQVAARSCQAAVPTTSVQER